MGRPIIGRPVIGRPPVKIAPVQAKPQPKMMLSSHVAKENQALVSAKAAVANFERQYKTLQSMRAAWEREFPEALQALNEVKRQEDVVMDMIKTTKPLVAAAKMTIGDFLAQRKWDSAHYDGVELTRILALTQNAPKIFMEMLQAGILEALDLNRDASLGWFAQHPAYATIFNKAFRPETEGTTAVTVPKI